MTHNKRPVLVFTDLDGTLLDHETYAYDAASEALELLRNHSIPLILASSKTASEIAPLREQLGFAHCAAIVENGAGVLEAGQTAAQAKGNYQSLLDTLSKIDKRLKDQFKGFSQLSAEEIADLTSLSLADAKLAKARQYSEPGQWLGNQRDFEKFRTVLDEQGIVVQQGGRFVSLSFGGNKADRLREICTRHANTNGAALTIALGDSHNDINMLLASDIGVIVANPHGVPIPELDGEADGRIIRTKLAGPSGWNRAVIDVLKNMERNQG